MARREPRPPPASPVALFEKSILVRTDANKCAAQWRCGMATVLEQPHAAPILRIASQRPRRNVIDAVNRAMPWLVFVLAAGIGLSLYASVWAESRHLWYV